MIRLVRIGLPLLLLALFLSTTGVASAQGADQHSQNMKLLASLPKTRVTNSDIAFWGKLAYQGSYAGFRVIDIADPEAPSVLADVKCGSGQGDVTVWQNILVRSVDYPMTERSCALRTRRCRASSRALRSSTSPTRRTHNS